MMDSYSQCATIRYVLAFRDVLQSTYGGKIPHNVPEIIAILKLLKSFNDAGPVQIVGIEGHAGALPEYDVRQGRLPFKVAKDLNVMDKSLMQRPLIRGPFGITLDAKETGDLEIILRELAETAGAKNGRRVVFKLFEAQNRASEHLDSLRIISKLKAEGYDVACEVAMVVSPDKAKLDITYYANTAHSLMSVDRMRAEGINPTVIAGFSVKDMIGGLKGARPGEDERSVNVENVARIAMEAMQGFIDATGQQLYLGWHMHEIGNGVAALSSVARTYNAERGAYPGITELQFDAMMGSSDPENLKNYGFVDLEQLLDSMCAEDIAVGMNDAQKRIWNDMKLHMLQMHNRNLFHYTDPGKWSKELLEYGQLASGGLPYVENNGIKPILKFIANIEVRPGVSIGLDSANKIVRCLFASINGLIDRDLGDAHSVTPAMKFANDLTINSLGAFIEPKFIDFIRQRVEAKKDWSKPLIDDEVTALFRSSYRYFSNVKAMAYFCTPMPSGLNDDMLRLLRRKLFDHYFPKNFNDLMSDKVKPNNSAIMLKNLAEEGKLDEKSYLALRAELYENVLDKGKVKQLLIAAGVDAGQAEAFTAAHIGVNSLPINHGVKPRFDRTRNAVERVVDELDICRVVDEVAATKLIHHTTLASLILPPSSSGIPREVIATVRQSVRPKKLFQGAPKVSWAQYITERRPIPALNQAGTARRPEYV